jgi:multiple antibiotic resistance protein
MGFLMVCIGVQFAINGVRDLLHDPDFWPRHAAAILTLPAGAA